MRRILFATTALWLAVTPVMAAAPCAKQLSRANAALKNASDLSAEEVADYRSRRARAKALCTTGQVHIGRAMLQEMAVILRSRS